MRILRTVKVARREELFVLGHLTPGVLTLESVNPKLVGLIKEEARAYGTNQLVSHVLSDADIGVYFNTQCGHSLLRKGVSKDRRISGLTLDVRNPRNNIVRTDYCKMSKSAMEKLYLALGRVRWDTDIVHDVTVERRWEKITVSGQLKCA